MLLRVEECCNYLYPQNILDLLPKEIFEEIIIGFSHWSGRGVVLLYADYEPSMKKWIVKKENRIEPPELGKDFSVFCRDLREHIGKDKCFTYDCEIAQKYVNNGLDGYDNYQCWAKLCEAAYPLKFGGGVRAVLLAGGQVIPEDPAGREKVKKAILQLPDGAAIWNKLKASFKKERNRQKNLRTTDESQQRLEDLGRTLKVVIDVIYDQRIEKVMRILQEDLQNVFGKADMSERDIWWKDISQVFTDICKIVGIKKIEVYQIQHSFYYSLDKGVIGRFETNQVARNIPVDKITKQHGLVEYLERWAYRTEQRADRIVVSTLMMIDIGNFQKPEPLVENICRMIGRFMDMAALVFEVQEAKRVFEVDAGIMAHSVRTPLQSICLEIPILKRLLKNLEDYVELQIVDRIEERVFDTAADMKILLLEATEIIEDVDVMQITESVINGLEPQARQKRCWITNTGKPKGRIFVRVNLSRFRWALNDLIENAIKYSWADNPIEVNIKDARGYVVIQIKNYGLGIAPEKMKEIKQFGYRGGSRDESRPIRAGTGWGLASAYRTLQRYGGALEIQSKPVDNKPRSDKDRYHRYNTYVHVTLPVRIKTRTI